jgi:hypothetical protein
MFMETHVTMLKKRAMNKAELKNLISKSIGFFFVQHFIKASKSYYKVYRIYFSFDYNYILSSYCKVDRKHFFFLLLNNFF